MVIKTKIELTEDEVYKIINAHFMSVHKLEIDAYRLKTLNNDFNGFDLTIKEIMTSVEEIHENTPNFIPEEKKVMI